MRIVISEPAPVRRYSTIGLIVLFIGFLPTILRVQAAGLIANWKFDEGSGFTARDSAGQFHGTLSPTGARYVPTGVANHALSLTAADNGFVNMGNVLNFARENFSIAAWIKTETGDRTDNRGILSKHLSGFDNGYFLGLNRSGFIGAQNKALFFAGSSAAATVSRIDINDGQWHHLAGVYEASGNQILYVDGARAAVTNASRLILSNSVPFLIGGFSFPEPRGRFTGWIDEVQIYNKALTSTEIDFLYTHPGEATPPTGSNVLTITPFGGLFTNFVLVSLTTSLSDADMRYTVDNSLPTPNSFLYTGVLKLTEATILQARTFVNNFPVSDVLTSAFQRVYAINDGISPAWRQQFFGPSYLTDPRVSAIADPDQDGASNLQEFLAGTSPLDPLSGFAVQIKAVPLLTWKSISNNTYRIFRKDFVSSSWTPLADFRATSSVSSFVDVEVSNATAFYGLTVMPLE